MIAEAVDAALLLWRALWWWLLAGAVVVTVGGLVAVAGVWWAVNAVRNALSARLPAEHPADVPRLPRPRERPATPHSALPPGERKRSEAA